MFDFDSYNTTHITDFNDVVNFPSWFLWFFPFFNTVLITLSVAGNVLIIYATWRYNAIDLGNHGGWPRLVLSTKM